MKKFIFITTIVSALILTGCGNGFSKDNYVYEPQPSDPTLVFTSDYEVYTHFWLNDESPAETRQCSNTHPAGFLLKTDSIFIFDKPVMELETKVPANKEITIMGSSSGENVSCGPIYKAFTPEKNKNYIVHFEKAGNYCRMNIIEQKTNIEVNSRKVSHCIK